MKDGIKSSWHGMRKKAGPVTGKAPTLLMRLMKMNEKGLPRRSCQR